MARKSCINIGNCGEYFVAAELERRGFDVAVPMSNTPTFDLLAIQLDDISKQVAIQVKTNSGSNNNWKLNKKNEIINDKNVFYVFVKLNGLGIPEYYIVPSEVVATQISETHKTWLATLGKKGQPHNDNPMRVFHLPANSTYKDAWDSLKK